MNRPIKAVTFDAGGTLIHLKEPVGKSYATVAKDFDIGADPEKLDISFRKLWKMTPPPFQAASPAVKGLETEKTWWREMVRKVFRMALDTSDFTSPHNFSLFFDRLYDHFAEPGVWELDSDVLPVLEYLETTGVKKGIISNFDERLHVILKDLKVLERFDMIVISNEIKASKPDKRIFDHAISELKLPADQIIHVGDDPDCDVAGSEAAGMKSFLVGKQHEPLIGLIGKLPLAPP